MQCIVELEVGVWYAEWEGDPGRTLVRKSAKRFKSEAAANNAIRKARKYRPFKTARVVLIFGVDWDLVPEVITPDELKNDRDDTYDDWFWKQD